MKLKDLLAGVSVLEATVDMELNIENVSYDSRKVNSGDLFVAIAGFASDGNRFIPMAMEKGAVAVVKGLRAVSDFEYEFQQAQMNKKLNSQLETVFMNTRVENLYLSSSVVKQICELGGDISDFVPEAIRDDIVKRIKRGVSK